MREYYLARRKRVLGKHISTFVNRVCIDFNEGDKEFLKSEILDKLLFYNMTGLSTHAFILASIFLMSKCPANSDKPLTLLEVAKRGRLTKKEIFRSVKKLRKDEVFPMVCRVTCEQIILNYKDKTKEFIYSKCDERDKPKVDRVFDRLIDTAISVSKEKDFRFLFAGRNPYCLSQCLVYAVLFNYRFTTLNQLEIKKIFGCTDASMRNILYKMHKQYKDKKKLYHSWDNRQYRKIFGTWERIQ